MKNLRILREGKPQPKPALRRGACSICMCLVETTEAHPDSRCPTENCPARLYFYPMPAPADLPEWIQKAATEPTA